jgi:hypothetical protein
MTKRTLFRCFGTVSLFLPVSLLAQKDAASLSSPLQAPQNSNNATVSANRALALLQPRSPHD